MSGMTVIVKTITRWVKVFIFLFGAYIIVTGHLSPGGGFAGGVSKDVDQAMGFVRCHRVKAHAVRAEVERLEIAAYLRGAAMRGGRTVARATVVLMAGDHQHAFCPGV